uniref:Endonuclease/exonuclease/phosphatase domain-containing protein n=2 Tax=Graphocephala atropunctata TaxID=36148 RepID=A0A1B6LI07_9HEMI
MGLNISYTDIISSGQDARSCLTISTRLKWSPVLEFCSWDLMAVTIAVHGSAQPLIISSAYLPYNKAELPPLREVYALVDHAARLQEDILIGCVANSHNKHYWRPLKNEANGRGSFLQE